MLRKTTYKAYAEELESRGVAPNGDYRHLDHFLFQGSNGAEMGLAVDNGYPPGMACVAWIDWIEPRLEYDGDDAKNDVSEDITEALEEVKSEYGAELAWTTVNVPPYRLKELRRGEKLGWDCGMTYYEDVEAGIAVYSPRADGYVYVAYSQAAGETYDRLDAFLDKQLGKNDGGKKKISYLDSWKARNPGDCDNESLFRQAVELLHGIIADIGPERLAAVLISDRSKTIWQIMQERFPAYFRPERWWDLIPAQTYKAILSRQRDLQLGKRAYGVSEKTLRDCLDKICGNFFKLKFGYWFTIGDGTDASGWSKAYDTPLIDVLEDCGYRDGPSAIGYLLECATSFVPPEAGRRFGECYSDTPYTFEAYQHLLSELPDEPTADQMVTAINKCVDICHNRGSLAWAFVEGGENTCKEASEMGPDEIYESRDPLLQFWARMLDEATEDKTASLFQVDDPAKLKELVQQGLPEEFSNNTILEYDEGGEPRVLVVCEKDFPTQGLLCVVGIMVWDGGWKICDDRSNELIRKMQLYVRQAVKKLAEDHRIWIPTRGSSDVDMCGAAGLKIMKKWTPRFWLNSQMGLEYGSISSEYGAGDDGFNMIDVSPVCRLHYMEGLGSGWFRSPDKTIDRDICRWLERAFRLKKPDTPDGKTSYFKTWLAKPGNSLADICRELGEKIDRRVTEVFGRDFVHKTMTLLTRRPAYSKEFEEATQLDRLVDRKNWWDLIPDRVYKAMVSRAAHPELSRGVSLRTICDCLDMICRDVVILYAQSRRAKSIIQNSRILSDIIAGAGDEYMEYESAQLVDKIIQACGSYIDKTTYVKDGYGGKEDDGYSDKYGWADFQPVAGTDFSETLSKLFKDLYSIPYDEKDPAVLIAGISKLIDRAHGRGSLAGAFIEGGANACSEVSNMKPDEIYESRRILRESQPAADKRQTLELVFGGGGMEGQFVMTLNAHFMRNGNNCYDVIYTTDAPFIIKAVDVQFDAGSRTMTLECADAGAELPEMDLAAIQNEYANRGAGAAERAIAAALANDNPALFLTYHDIYTAAMQNDFSFGECSHMILKFGQYCSIDVMDAKARLQAGENGLTLKWNDEFWITDVSFFDRWSSQLWDDDEWSSDQTRDEEDAYLDIYHAFIDMLDDRRISELSQIAGIDEQTIRGMIDSGEILDDADVMDIIVDIADDVDFQPSHLVGPLQRRSDQNIAQRMVQVLDRRAQQLPGGANPALPNEG